MKIEDIEKSITKPSQLEGLFRQDSIAFTKLFPAIFEKHQESPILQVWQERLFFKKQSVSSGTGASLVIASILTFVTGLLVKIPSYIELIDNEWFYSRYSVLLVLSALSVYFLKLRHAPTQKTQISITLLATVFLTIGLLPFPEKSDTFALACIHAPLIAWTILAFSFTKHWKSPHSRIEFLRYNGELIVYTIIILIGGMVLTGITLALFSLIKLDISNWYMENIVIMGLVASPIIATYIIESGIGAKTSIASVIAKIFSPLFLVTVCAYLLAMVVAQKSPYTDRNFLITFNFLLILVLAISVFSIIEKKNVEKSKLIEITNIALIVVTILIDIVALSAISYRLLEFGLTPNRIVVLGANLLIFIHLCGLVKFYIKFALRNDSYEEIKKWTADFLPVYSCWSVIVVLVIPVIFGFK